MTLYQVETQYEMESQYPVFSHKKEIIEMVKNNQVSIIKAETGAGKSTQIPKYLLESGYNVFITVPSRAAATSLASRVSYELNSELGNLVGYHTAFEKSFSESTKILYTTEGLQFIKELLNRNNSIHNKVLIIDEVQEWGINVEALVAWVRKKISEKWDTKVVLMSASLDTRAVSEFLDNAPILEIEGKLFDIEDRISSSEEFVDTILGLSTEGRNVLAFVPGKREIEQTITALSQSGVNAEIFPMYADLPIKDQSRVFLHTLKPKIVVSTNVAQTSITIPDIDAVVDTGLERRMMMIDGLSTLSIGDISFSDHIQRRGRAGRTKPGIYIWCSDVELSKLQQYPTPDIYTSQLHQIVLKLASIGVNALDVLFFHQPPTEQIIQTQKTLRILGAFDENNEITEIGQKMNMFPIDVRYSRMIVAAEKYGVLADVATIAAIQSFGSIKGHNVPYAMFSRELKSDLLAELDCFNHVKSLVSNSNLPFYQDDSSKDSPFYGISKRNYFRAMELRSKLYDILYNMYGDVSSTGNRQSILKSCATGFIDLLYIRGENEWYSCSSDEFSRKLNIFSATLPSKMILGLPKNISYVAPNGLTQTLYLISSSIMVDMNILREIAPQLITEDSHDRAYNPGTNTFTKTICTKFVDTIVDESEVIISDIDEKLIILINWLVENSISPHKSISSMPALFNMLSKNKFALVTSENLYNWYKTTIRENFRNSVPNLRKNKSIEILTYDATYDA